MAVDRVLWFLAALSFFIGALLGLPAKPGKLQKVGWMLLGFGFIALTFVF